MADRLLEGRLTERLTALRQDGRSFDDIAKALHGEGGVEVSGETLRIWARQLGIEPEVARS